MGALLDGQSYISRCCLWVTLLLCMLPFSAAAQPYLTRNYAIEEGLIQSQAADMLQDRDGYLWIGTMGGLSRFDGLNFTHFTMEEGLINNRITALAEAQNGDLWTGSTNGITVISDTAFQQITTQNGLLDNAINDLLATSDGKVWIASLSGLSSYSNGSLKHYTTEDGLTGTVVLSIKEGMQGDVWAATNNGLCNLKDESFTCYTNENGLPHSVVSDVLIDSKQRIWATTPAGVAILSTDGLFQFMHQSHLPALNATSIIEDASGAIWIGSRNGVIRTDAGAQLTHTWHDGNWIVASLLEDSEHNIWAGTSGRGIVKFQQTAFSHMNPVLNLPTDVYLAVFEDSKQRNWIGAMVNGLYLVDSTGVTHYDAKKYPAVKHIRSLAEDTEGNLWIGTANGASKFDGKKFTRYGVQDGLVSSYVFSIKPDQHGRIWMGTSNGLSIYEDGEFTTVDLQEDLGRQTINTLYEDPSGRMWAGSNEGRMYVENGQVNKIDATHKRPVSTILPDNTGNLWLGTLGYGVLKFSPGQNILTDSLNVTDGLNGNTVYFTRFDGAGDLWIGTSRGVNHVDLEAYHMEGSKKVRAFGKTDGIVGLETNMNAAMTDHQGRLWFGTIDGLIHYDASVRPINMTTPPIHITGLRLYSEKIDPAEYEASKAGTPRSYAFQHDQNHLTFDFLGLSYAAPEHVQYQYRLKGFNADWVHTSKSRYATYSNLPAGKYTFEVSAINSDGVPSGEAASFAFAIKPAFWNTSWFIGLSILFSILGIVGIIQRRTNNLNKRRIELEDTVTERTQDLKNTHEALLEAREEALQAAKSKSAFMSAMTHELRTPMNGIIGMTQVLTISDIDEDQLDCVETILDCSSLMMELIENLLSFADLAAGQRTLSMERFSLPDLLKESISAIQSRSIAKQLEAHYYLSLDAPLEIEGDREHIRQILQHLLSNGLKFT